MRFDYCEHIDGPQGFFDQATKRLRPGKGGGGGAVKYKNLETLYGVQSRAAQFMLDQAMPNLSDTFDNSSQMLGEAMDGTLAKRAREQAGADASNALGQGLDAVNRNNARYGAEFNQDRMAAMGAGTALAGATTKANAMNQAGRWAEDQKWNRNAGLYSQAAGTGSGAMSGMSSAGSGLSGIVGMQNQTDMANAQGYGMAGAMMGNALLKADGGYISRSERRRGHGLKPVKLAGGGDAWENYKRQNSIKTNGQRGSAVNPAASVAMGAAPYLAAAGLKDVIKGRDSAAFKTISKWLQPGAASAAPESAAPVAESALLAQAPSQGIESLPSSVNTAEHALGAAASPGLVSGAVDAASSGAGSVGLETLGDSVAATQAAVDPALIADAAQTWGSAAGSLFADGGAVCKAKGHGLRLAGGGLFKAMPSVASMDASSSMAMPRVSKLDDAPKRLPAVGQQSVAAQSPIQAGDGIRGAKIGSDAAKSAEAADKAKDAGSAALATESAANATKAADVVGATQAAESAGDAADAAGKAADSSSSAVPYGSFIKAGADLLSGRDPGAAVADAALGYGGAQAGAAAGTAVLPGVGTVVGGLLGGLLGGSIFADGGDVDQRQDFTPGGDVQGPGTETSDSIPAWLSNGEIVENAEAVKIAGKDALLAINQAGRDVREGNASPQEAAKEIGRVMVERGQQLAGDAQGSPLAERLRSFSHGRRKGAGLKNAGAVKLAGGGLLGVALGAGVNQLNKQQMIDQQQQQIDLQKQNSERQGKMMARQESEWAKQDALTGKLSELSGREQAGDVDAYIDGKQDEAKAAAAISGLDYQPLSDEQRSVIKQTKGIGKMTPHLRYELEMARGQAYQDAGDHKTANEYRDRATQRAAGDAISALISKDARTFGKMYHVFPNGDTPDAVDFDQSGDLVFDRGGQKQLVKRKDAILSALSIHDPKTAASMFQNGELVAERLDNWMKAQEARNKLAHDNLETKLAIAASRGAGNGSGKSGKGDGAADGELYLDRKKFNEGYGYDKENADEGDVAHAFYADLYATARKGGPVSEATNTKLAMQAKQMAKGKTLPVVDFDDQTVGFRYGIKDAQGGLRYLQSNNVDGELTKNTMTGKPFWSAEQVRDKELSGLQAFAKRDPEAVAQAARLLSGTAESWKNAESMAEHDIKWRQVVNAAKLMAKYRDAKPDAGQPAPGATAGEFKPFGSSNPDYEYSAARDRVQKNSQPGHIPGLVDTVSEWLSPKLIGK